MLKKYYDMHVTTKYSTGVNTVEEIIKRAERLGLDTVAILDRVESPNDLLAIRKDAEAVSTTLNVLVGTEIVAENPTVLHKKINKFRDAADIIAVFGGDIDINRCAVESPKVDILTHPELKRKDSGMDHVMMKLAAENQVAIELNFREYLYSYRKIRTYILSHMRQNVMLSLKFGASVIVTSGAESIWDMRAGRELASLAYLSGLDRESAVGSVSDAPANIVRKNEGVKASHGD